MTDAQKRALVIVIQDWLARADAELIEPEDFKITEEDVRAGLAELLNTP